MKAVNGGKSGVVSDGDVFNTCLTKDLTQSHENLKSTRVLAMDIVVKLVHIRLLPWLQSLIGFFSEGAPAQ